MSKKEQRIADVLEQLGSEDPVNTQSCLEGIEDGGVFDALLRGFRYSRYGSFSIKNKHYQDMESPDTVAISVALHAPPKHERVRAPRNRPGVQLVRRY